MKNPRLSGSSVTKHLLAVACTLGWLNWGAGLSELMAQCDYPYWLEVSPAQWPAAQRGHHGLAYDSQRAVTVLYGGFPLAGLGSPPPPSDAAYNDTWEFDGFTWVQRLPATVPLKLSGHSMSYDPVKRVTIMFGGRVGTNGSSPNSGILWEWDGQDWREVPSVGQHPRPRFGHKMVYDRARGVHVLFGGEVYDRDPGETYDTLRPVAETWEYDALACTWTLRATNGPARRSSFDMAYDALRNRTVLFGGRLRDAPTLAASYANDTWTWDGGAGVWQKMSPQLPPPGSAGHAMAFDSTRGVVVLLGGTFVLEDYTESIVTAQSASTWDWNGVEWHPLIGADFCCGISGHTMVYETARQQLLLFENTGNSINDPMRTWIATTGNGQPLNYVDGSAPFIIEDGSASHPFHTFHQAVRCTMGGSTISIRGGDYAEGALSITKQLTLTVHNGPVSIH